MAGGGADWGSVEGDLWMASLKDDLSGHSAGACDSVT